jgi:hypothetical protein
MVERRTGGGTCTTPRITPALTEPGSNVMQAAA